MGKCLKGRSKVPSAEKHRDSAERGGDHARQNPRAFGDGAEPPARVVEDPVRCEIEKYILWSRLRAQAVNP